MTVTIAKYAIVRPVPESYDQCVRTNTQQIYVELAKQQHKEYCRVLEQIGLKLIWINGCNALADSCFVEDTAVIFDEKAIICSMKVKSRAPEVNAVAKVLAGFKEIHYIKPPATIDGGDVLKIKVPTSHKSIRYGRQSGKTWNNQDNRSENYDQT